MSMTDNQMRQAFERFRDEYSIRGYSEADQRTLWGGGYWDETYTPNLNNPDFVAYRGQPSDSMKYMYRMNLDKVKKRQAFERFRDEYSIRGFSEELQRTLWGGEYWDETYVPNLNNPDFQYYKVDAAIGETIQQLSKHMGVSGKLGKANNPIFPSGGTGVLLGGDPVAYADLMCADNKGGELRPLPPFEPFTAEKARKHMQSTAEFIHVMGRVIEHIQAAANLGKWGTEVLIVDDAHVVSAIDTAIHCDNMSRITSVIIKALEDFGYDVVIEPDTGALCITWFKE